MIKTGDVNHINKCQRRPHVIVMLHLYIYEQTSDTEKMCGMNHQKKTHSAREEYTAGHHFSKEVYRYYNTGQGHEGNMANKAELLRG